MDFSSQLVQWYHQNKRSLPWRNTTNAYVIWLSEIILQQTRVQQGLPYFNRFLERYPTVADFAAAQEDDVLKLWQGLGYYSRGRNMLKTARLVQEIYNGDFPTRYEELIKLTGIGEYTAAAISSFSANEARAVVDGNVYRVLSRFFGIDEPINSTKGKKMFQALADEVLNKEYPALHNQAMMEFGAMLCKPKSPACGICPVREGCFAFLNKAINTLPVKLNKVKIRERYLNYFLVTDGDKVLINKRGENDIWANLYDLPLIETATQLEPAELFAQLQVIELFGNNINYNEISPVKKHVLTHQWLYVRLIHLRNIPLKMSAQWRFFTVDELRELAMPRIIIIFIKDIFNL